MEKIIVENVQTPDVIDYERVLALAIGVGKGLLSVGSSVSRVEIAVERICLSYGVKDVDVWCVPSMVLCSVISPAGEYYTQSQRVYSISNDLCKMEKYNQLSRDICVMRPPMYIAENHLYEIDRQRSYSPLAMTILGGFAAASFCVLFGGGFLDAIVTFPIGMLMAFTNVLLSLKMFNSYARTFILSVIGGICSVLLGTAVVATLRACNATWVCHIDMIMIGTTMLVAPGLLVCNAMRDLFVGDLISGIIQILNGIIIILVVAGGYALAMVITKPLNGYYDEVVEMAPLAKYLYLFVAAIIAVVAFSMTFGMHPTYPKYRLLIATLNALVAYGIYQLCLYLTHDSLFISNLIMALYGAAASELLARITKAPSTVYVIPFLILFVPGGSLYYMMANLIQGNTALAGSYGLDALLIFLGISVGLSVMTVLFQIIKPVKRKHRSKTLKEHFKNKE